MPRFAYKAINEVGKTVSGTLAAETVEQARQNLGNMKLVPMKISRTEKGPAAESEMSFQEKTTRVRPTDLIMFTKQLRTMLRAGISIVRVFEILTLQTENLKLRKIATLLARDVNEGSSLNEAFRKHPRVFDNLYCSMIEAGETSGSLPEVMDRLCYLIDHENKVKSRIRSAFQYPIIVVVFLVVAFFILLTFVIPQFIKTFEAAKIDLPLPTVICNVMYHFLVHYWYLLLGGTVAVFFALRYYFKTEKGRLARDRVILRLPLLGPVFVKAAMSRFASIFAILQSSGVGVLDSMRILSGTIGNDAISGQFDRLRTRLEEGLGIAGPLRSGKYFTPMVINMVAIGEESGNLDEMLLEVSKHYDDEVEYATDRLSEMLGPILVVGLAAVVGFFALAIFLPMWDLTKMVR